MGDIVIDANELFSGRSGNSFRAVDLDTSGRVVVGSGNISSTVEVEYQFNDFRDELGRWEARSHGMRKKLGLD